MNKIFQSQSDKSYIKYLESELLPKEMTKNQTIKAYKKQNDSLKNDNQILRDKISQLESEGKH